MRIGYARISTADQSHALQMDALAQAGCERVFEETASGARADRPELAAALAYCRKGDALVVWRLDRLARSLRQLIDTVALLEAQGVGLISLHENIDTSTPTGRLVFHVFGALAEFERDLISERTRAGLKAARQRGRKSGPKPKLSPEDIASAKVLLADPDHSARAVAEHFGVSVATLYRAIPAARAGVDERTAG